jgi:AAA domain/DnaB-like helicase N terminal domain
MVAGGFMSKPRGIGRIEPKALPPPAIIDKIPPPHDLEVERLVLAGLLWDFHKLDDVAFLSHTKFYSGQHRAIMRAIEGLVLAGTPVDPTNVRAWLIDRDELQMLEGRDTYLLDLRNTTASAIPRNFIEYARRIDTLAKLRELAGVVQRINARVYVDRAEPLEVFAEAERLVTDVVRTAPGMNVARIGAAEIFEAEMADEPPWLCKALRLAPGRVTLAAGSPDSGKTLSWQSIGVSVATGADAWGVFNVARRGLVVHLNWDQELDATKRRYRKLLRGRGMGVDSIRGYLEVIDDPAFALDSDAGIAEVRAIARGATLVIIDALTGSLADTDENDPAVGRVLRKLGKISEQTGCVIVVIHHAVKPPQMRGRGGKRDAMHDVRGSSSIPGASGAVFVQSPIRKGELYAVEMARTPTVAKRALDPFALRFEDVAEGEGEQVALDGSRVRPAKGEAVRIVYVPPEELSTLTKKADGKPEAGAAFEQFARLVLEKSKLEPDMNTSELHQRFGRGTSRERVEAALAYLVRKQLIAAHKGARNANVWRAV